MKLKIKNFAPEYHFGEFATIQCVLNADISKTINNDIHWYIAAYIDAYYVRITSILFGVFNQIK